MAGAVRITARFGFTVQIECFIGLKLHPKGGFHRFESCVEHGILIASCRMLPIQLTEKSKLLSLGRLVPARITKIRNHLSRFNLRMIDIRALVLGGQKGAVPKNRKSDGSTGAEDDVARQILVLTAQAIQKPGSHAWPRRDDRPVVHLYQCGTMIRVVGM